MWSIIVYLCMMHNFFSCPLPFFYTKNFKITLNNTYLDDWCEKSTPPLPPDATCQRGHLNAGKQNQKTKTKTKHKKNQTHW